MMGKKAVVLAAGGGTRMHPLTETRPKPLIQVMGKSFLYYVLDNLSKAGYDDVCIVVGVMQQKIREFVDEYGFKVTFVEQDKQLGTGDAVKRVRDFVGDDNFIVLMGDNLYSDKDLGTIPYGDDLCYLSAMKSECPERYGVVSCDKDGYLVSLTEKPDDPGSDLVSVGLYKFTPEIFDKLDMIEMSHRGEIEVVDAISLLADEKKVKVYEIKDYWYDLGYPWDIFRLNEFLLGITPEYRKGSVSPKAELVGKVIVEIGAEIKPGVHIEGPVYIGKNCKIGPNCYIRGATSLSDYVHVGASVEVKNSVIFNNTNIPHHNYVGDSVIGAYSNLGSGTKIANLRHDNQHVMVNVKGQKVDTFRRKIGAIIGDNVKIGINSALMPGVKVGSSCMVGPSVVLYNDLPKGCSVFLKQDQIVKG